MRRGWKVIAAGTGLLMLGTAIGTLGDAVDTPGEEGPGRVQCAPSERPPVLFLEHPVWVLFAWVLGNQGGRDGSHARSGPMDDSDPASRRATLTLAEFVPHVAFSRFRCNPYCAWTVCQRNG